MKLTKLYFFAIFMLYIVSMQPWFMWHFSYAAVYAVGALMSMLFAVANNNNLKWSNSSKRLFLFLFIGVAWLSFRSPILVIVGNIFLLISMFVFLGTSREFKLRLLEYVKKWFAVLLLISLVFYFLYVVGIPLPSVYTEYGLYGVDNYFFFVLTYDDLGGFNRFRSIFGEPGFMTIGIIPLFVSGRFNLKDKSLLILLIAELVSFSLAGYLILLIALLYYCFWGAEYKKYARVFTVVILSGATLFTVANKDFFDLIDTNILSRIAFNEDTGTIMGNNRSTEYMEYMFDKFKKTPAVVYGIGTNEMNRIRKTTGIDDNGGNAGFKIYTYMYGIIGVVLFLFYYFMNFFQFRSRDGLMYFLCLVLLLYQAGYVTWYCTLIGSYLCFFKLGQKQILSPQYTK